MNELDERLKSQTEYGSGLWRMARRECRARVLARSVAQLRRAHRALAQRDATLPRTASAGRHQRQSVELLQSHARAVEAQVVKVNAIAAELETAVGKRLATLEALCLAAPVGSRREGARRAHPLLAIIPLFAIILLLTAGSIWDGEAIRLFCNLVVVGAVTRALAG